MSVVTRVPTRLPIALGVALLLAAVGFLLFRWWIGPTPAGEAQEYFDRQAPGVVEVIDCEYAEAGRSVFDRYYCVLRAEDVVPHPPGDAWDCNRAGWSAGLLLLDPARWGSVCAAGQ